jgi:hypothetical protein
MSKIPEANCKIYIICQTISVLGVWTGCSAIAILVPTYVVWTLIAGVVATAVVWRGDDIFC